MPLSNPYSCWRVLEFGWHRIVRVYRVVCATPIDSGGPRSWVEGRIA